MSLFNVSVPSSSRKLSQQQFPDFQFSPQQHTTFLPEQYSSSSPLSPITSLPNVPLHQSGNNFFWPHSESNDSPESSNLHPSRSSSDQIYPFHDSQATQAQKTTPIRFPAHGNIAMMDTKVRSPVCQYTWLIPFHLFSSHRLHMTIT
jgi:hypothetical protein